MEYGEAIGDGAAEQAFHIGRTRIRAPAALPRNRHDRVNDSHFESRRRSLHRQPKGEGQC